MRFIRTIFSTKPEVLFVIIALFFGAFSALIVPQLSVNDEGAHLYRAYSLSNGHITGGSCSYPQEIIDKVRDSGKGVYSFNLSQHNSDTLVAYGCGSAGDYYPTMHLPQSIGFLISKVIYDSPALMVLLGRLANLIFFAVAMYLIIKFVVMGKWVFFVIGLLPVTVHAAASLSYDTFNTVAILAFIAVTLNLFVQKIPLSTKKLLLLLALSLLMATAKTTNLILLLLVCMLPLRLFKKTPTSRSARLNKLLVVAGIILASLISIFAWQRITGGILPNNTPNRVDENPLYFLAVLYNTYVNPFLGYSDVVVRGVVGEFSSFKYHLPSFLVIVSYGLVAFALLAKESGSKTYAKERMGLLAASSTTVFVVSVLAITYGLYSLWATLPTRFGPNAIYADGVQGRYFTPLIALLVPLGVWLRKYIHIATSSPLIPRVVLVSTATLLLMFYTMQTISFAY